MRTLADDAAYYRKQADAVRAEITQTAPSLLALGGHGEQLHRDLARWTMLADEVDAYLAVDDEHDGLF